MGVVYEATEVGRGSPLMLLFQLPDVKGGLIIARRARVPSIIIVH